MYEEVNIKEQKVKLSHIKFENKCIVHDGVILSFQN